MVCSFVGVKVRGGHEQVGGVEAGDQRGAEGVGSIAAGVREVSALEIARSTHSVVVTPSASATASTRKSRFIGNLQVTAMRRDVRIGLPGFAGCFSTGDGLLWRRDKALPDA